MTLSEKHRWIIGLFVTIVPVTVMQGIGCFTPLLLTTDKYGDLGLYSVSCFDPCDINDKRDKYDSWETDYKGPRKISEQAFKLQVIAFTTCIVLSIVAFIAVCLKEITFNSTSCLGMLTIAATIVYPSAGVSCLIGCGLVANSEDRPENSTLGVAFYLSLLAGIYIIAQCVVFYGVCIKAESENDTSNQSTTSNRPQQYAVAMTTTSREVVPATQTAAVAVEVEGTVVQESNGLIFLRKIRLTRAVQIFR